MSAVGSAVRGVGARQGRSSILVAARLDSALPSGLSFTRAAGAGSYQTAAAGAPFITIFTSGNADVPRYHYFAAADRRLLLVEPARTNDLLDANFADAGGNDIPDGWTLNQGTPGTDFNVITSFGPHNGAYLEFVGAVAAGVYRSGLGLLNATKYTASIWMSGASLSAGERVYLFRDLVPTYYIADAPSGTYAWSRQSVTATTAATGDIGYMNTETALTGTLRLALPQIEVGAYPSTWIPTTSSTATRPAERCQLSASLVSGAKGTVSFLWCPLWANTEVSGTVTLFAWGANDRIDFDGASDTIRVVNNSATRATSAALSFSRETLHRIRVDYGSFGTKLSVDGAETTDSNAWVSVGTLAPHLGSNASGANVESAGYGDLLCAA